MTPLRFDAALLARGWLSVQQAAGTDPKGRFYRAVNVEFYEAGVRLTATDTEVLLTAWVPRLDHEEDTPPALEQLPRAAVTALDHGQRAKGMFRYAYPLAVDEDLMDPLTIEVSLEKSENETQGQLPFEDLEGELLVFDLPGMERQRLAVDGAAMPNWRSLLTGHSRKRTTAISLAPPIIKRLAELGNWNVGALVWEFGGINGAARLGIGEGPVTVEGLVMPVRWEPLIEDEQRAEVEAAMDDGLAQDPDAMEASLQKLLEEEGGDDGPPAD